MRIFTLLALTFAIGACGATPETAPASPVRVTTAAGDLDEPLDAAPAPDGRSFFYIARTTRGPAVFRVPAGGGASVELFAGAPLVAPRGLVVSGDGMRLYVADPSAAMGGAIFGLATQGSSTPTVVTGTEGTRPTALDRSREGEVDVLTFTRSGAGGPAGVLRVPAAGGAVTTVFAGAPLQQPDGIAVNGSAIYVADRGGGTVYRVTNTGATSMVSNLRLGDPAGIATTLDGAKVLVSAHDATGHSQVVILDVATGAVSTYNGGISQNTRSGGLHRTATNDTFAWNGVTGPGGRGTVFRVALCVCDLTS